MKKTFDSKSDLQDFLQVVGRNSPKKAGLMNMEPAKGRYVLKMAKNGRL